MNHEASRGRKREKSRKRKRVKEAEKKEEEEGGRKEGGFACAHGNEKELLKSGACLATASRFSR